MPVSQQEHQSLLEKEIRLAINRSQAQEQKASDIWVRKNNNSSRSNYQHSVPSSALKKQQQGKKSVDSRRRGKSQMTKYAEKTQLTNTSTMMNEPDTPISIRKGSAGVLSPVFNSLVNAQMVYSGS